MPSTIRNINAAADVSQVDTITISNTWASGDTLTCEIQNQQVVMTCGLTMDSTAEVATGLSEVLNASTHAPASISADCVVNKGGQEIPQFRDIKASVSGSVVSVTGVTLGQPFTLTVTQTAAGSGLATRATATPADGKAHFDNVDNWLGGVAPGTGDTIMMDGTSGSLLYALDNSVADINVVTTAEYKGDIGLPLINGRGYTEYRQRFLDLPIVVTTGDQTATLDGTGRRYLDYGTVGDGDNTLAVTVVNSSSATPDGPPVQLVGGKRMAVRTFSGNVSISDHMSENPTELLSLNNMRNASVLVASTATFVDVAQSVNHMGGRLDFDAVCNGAATAIRIYDGEVIARENTDLDEYHQYGGRVDWRGVTLDSVSIYGGTFDLSNCVGVSIGTALFVYKGVTIIDPGNVIGTTIAMVGCNLKDVDLRLRDNLTLSISATTGVAVA
jgi:hypothetical protein